MTPRDNALSSSTSVRSSQEVGADDQRIEPQPTVLSRVWDGPSEIETERRSGSYPRPRNIDGDRSVDLGPNGSHHRVLDWLLAPTSRRWALVVTTVAAIVCGGFVVAGDRVDRTPSLSSSALDETIEETAEDAPTDQVSEADGSGAPTVRRAASADDQVTLTAERGSADAKTWMLEVGLVDDADPAPVVRFTVNGVVIGEIDRAPYRVILDRESLSSQLGADDTGRPLVVTATVLWSDADRAASPATVVMAG